MANPTVKPIEIISSRALFELTFSLKQVCSFGCVVAVILMQGQPPLSSQLCFTSSLLFFWEGSVLAPHLCGAGCDQEEGTIALQRAMTHYQIMQVSKVLLIQ